MPTTAGQSASDAFDGWTVSDTASAATFLQTREQHSGDAALSIVRDALDPPGVVPAMAQNVTVSQDSTVVVSFWAASDGEAAGAVQVGVGGAPSANVALPDGSFDWTPYSFSWTVPTGTTTMTLSILAAGTTAGTRIDDVEVQGQGSHTPQVQDGGFETSSAAISLDERGLIFEQSDVLDVRSRLAPDAAFSWTMVEYTGGTPIAGRARVAAGRATVPLAHVPPGYYTLTLRISVDGSDVQRSTDLVVTTPPPVGSSNPMLGVGVHFGGETDDQLAQKVADLVSLGIRTARTDADWSSIETRAGDYDFSALDRIVAALQKGGLRPLLIPDYRNALYDGGRTPSSPKGIAAYARFAAAVAKRYPDADVEVYNEFDFRFNDGACGKTPTCYLKLLGPTAAALRATGSSGAIAGPAIAGSGVQQNWLQGFIDGGGLQDVGALSLHPYVQPARPDLLEPELAALRASMAAAGGGATPIWFTEFGTATGSGGASEQQQAEDAARIFGVAAAHGVTRVYWYDAIDDGTDRSDPEDNFGLFRAPTALVPGAIVPKPAAAVLATAARLTATAAPQLSEPTGESLRRIDFGGASGVSLVWSPDGAGVETRVQSVATSMTGRRFSDTGSITVGSSPVWLTR